MKSADLIKMLQNIDPDGTLEVFVNGNEDIISIYNESMSCSGSPVKIIKKTVNGYTKESLKYLYNGGKIIIESRDYTDYIYGDPNIEIDYGELPERIRDDTKYIDDMTVAEARLLHEQSKKIKIDVENMLSGE